MSLPTLTWRQSSIKLLPTLDYPGALQALRDLIVSDGYWWGVNSSSFVAPKYIELKRINSPPAGELTTARALITQGTSPAAGAVFNNNPDSTNLFLALCTDANTGPSGPPVAYNVGEAYGGALGNSRLNRVSGGTPASGARIWFAECEEAFLFNLSIATTSSECGWFGRLLDLGDSIPRWLISAGTMPISQYPTGANAPWFFGGAQVSLNVSRTLNVNPGSGAVNYIARRSDAPMVANAIDGSPHISADGQAADLVHAAVRQGSLCADA
jgi:hypothetical protein